MNGAKSDWLWIGKNPTDFKEWLWEEWLKIGGTQNDCEWEGIRMTMNRKESNWLPAEMNQTDCKHEEIWKGRNHMDCINLL